MKIILFIITVILFCPNVSADTLPSKEKAKELAKNIMTEVGKGNMLAGAKLAKPYLLMSEKQYLALTDLMSMDQPIIDRDAGKTISVEVATVKEVGKSLMQIIYIQKFDEDVLGWKFIFYKPRNDWVLKEFGYDLQTQFLFQSQ